MKFLEEVKNEEMIDEVDESIPNVCRILVVDRKVEEIVFSLMISIDLSEKQSLSVPVWDVPYHDCGSFILTILDLLIIQLIHRLITCL
jgi:hypothetical protein